MTDAPPASPKVATMPRLGLQETIEGKRLCGGDAALWRKWGPYPSDRQWGTVREDYSPGGTAWEYFPHDHARSRAYRWGEDAIAGFSDENCFLNLGLAVWNGNDAIVKERLFGLTNSEGNHGEDVKELYFYTDAVPSHAYMRMLYKYPQSAFPYGDLVAENGRRDMSMPEYEILDTGVFNDNRSFDIVVEYVKAAPDDILMRVRAFNRSDHPALLHLLPQLTAGNIWSWSPSEAIRPRLMLQGDHVGIVHPYLPAMELFADQAVDWLFCENDTNVRRLYNASAPGPFKDGINDFLVSGAADGCGREAGTKGAAWLCRTIAAKGCLTLTLRLRPAGAPDAPFADADAIFADRRREADDFFGVLQRDIHDADKRLVQRQALAGLIWSKQYYCFDVYHWLTGDPLQPPPPAARWPAGMRIGSI